MIMSTVTVMIYGSVGSELLQMTLICVVCGFFINAAINGMYAMFAHAYPTQVRSAGTGFAIGVGRGGSILAPIAAGVMFDGGIGVPIVAAVLACGSLLAAIALLFLRLDSEPPEAVKVEAAGASAPPSARTATA
jgi:MFS family permease